MHQPYHDHPLLPPWQAMDYKARQRVCYASRQPMGAS